METPKDVIEERQRALAGPGDAPLSQRELTRLTEKFKGGPIASSTISRWASKMPGRARPEQLEIFAQATADATMPAERILGRLRSAFGMAGDGDGQPWEAPVEVEELTAEQKQWLTTTVRMLARMNRRQRAEPDEPRTAEPNGDVRGRPATGPQ